MKDFERRLLSLIADYLHDYGHEALFEEFFPGIEIGELIVDMYNAGLIPEDRIEEFLND